VYANNILRTVYILEVHYLLDTGEILSPWFFNWIWIYTGDTYGIRKIFTGLL